MKVNSSLFFQWGKLHKKNLKKKIYIFTLE